MSWRVLLPENPSTGYRWEPDEPPQSTNWRADAPDKIGGGGLREFVWDDDVRTVALVHRRSWEPPGQELERLFLGRKINTPTKEEQHQCEYDDPNKCGWPGHRR